MKRQRILPLILTISMLFASGCGNGAGNAQQPASEGQSGTDSTQQAPTVTQNSEGVKETGGNEALNLQRDSTEAQILTTGSPENQNSTAGVTEGPSVTESAKKPTDENSAEVVLKTDTNVSDKKSAEVLNKIDQEMDNLINVLNNMDDVSDTNLVY